jgi:hypothetical protein
MQLSSFQYWVLDEVVELVCLLSDLTPFLRGGESELGKSFPPIEVVVPLLNLTAPEIAQMIFPLFKIGYIAVGDYGANLNKDVCPSYEEILHALSGEGNLGPYGLTDLGGQIWENYSNPNWDYFTFGTRHYIDRNTCFECIRCSSRETLERLLIGSQIIPSTEISLIYPPQKLLIPGTEVWEALEQWKPTYWKTLEQGFQVEFQVVCNPEVSDVEGKIMTEEEITNYLFPKYLQENWYCKYFDLANQSR